MIKSKNKGPEANNKKKSSKRNTENKIFDKAEKYFNCTDRERAAFEAGVKLGSIFHQYVGTPISTVNVTGLEHAITSGVLIQPFVEDVTVKIDRDVLKNKHHEYDYDSLTGNMLNVQLIIKYRNSRAFARLEYIKKLHYPLMYITSIK